MPGLIVIGYDGTVAAAHAIGAAAPAVSATEAIVATVWRPALVAVSAGMLPAAVPFARPEEEDAALEAAAWRTAEEGVARAEDAGLHARPATRPGSTADIGRVLAELAEEHDADLILVGRRCVSRFEAAVMGSVSNDTLREARRPVLVVPARDA